jgi:polysaccharide pyruvyl transferase WcaK-like protein
LISEFPDLRPVIVTQSEEDADAALALGKALGMRSENVHRSLNPQDAIRIYSDGRLCFSARMHGAILALMSGCPSLLVDFDPGKSRPLLDDLGLTSLLVESGAATDDLLVAARRATRPSFLREVEVALAGANTRVASHREALASRVRDLQEDATRHHPSQ